VDLVDSHLQQSILSAECPDLRTLDFSESVDNYNVIDFVNVTNFHSQQ